jgi:hypothetical protein
MMSKPEILGDGEINVPGHWATYGISDARLVRCGKAPKPPIDGYEEQIDKQNSESPPYVKRPEKGTRLFSVNHYPAYQKTGQNEKEVHATPCQ